MATSKLRFYISEEFKNTIENFLDEEIGDKDLFTVEEVILETLNCAGSYDISEVKIERTIEDTFDWERVVLDNVSVVDMSHLYDWEDILVEYGPSNTRFRSKVLQVLIECYIANARYEYQEKEDEAEAAESDSIDERL